ncbi:hypothetical protein [Hymenobacter cavernae]|uniref:Outer membrane protein beta-barrel domain-containing protein n=1 Tax=Hymenobacter cavernae TaxID=2044852 RepID=A0ABQ1TSU7_9BACT|nr:hypothetical protein [Hymenobacter cavernae]GGF00460.1 hypothetical protein GCM10011383_09140 [Hymenobacter cavernae]
MAVAPSAWAQSESGSVSATDEPSYRKEVTYGINFNTRGGLIGGATVRSSKTLSQNWSRFWSIEGVEVKHPKEQRRTNLNTGGTYVYGKSNYLFALRPSFGVQRVIFRKAPESGVQVNGSLGVGPSIGLLMPYYIAYDETDRNANGQVPPNKQVKIVNEQYDPNRHSDGRIYDRAPLFSGIGETKPNFGAHLRGALSFEYGRYRDAVAGVEAGFLLEAYTKKLTILQVQQAGETKSLNEQFYPSVYLTIYLGHRS